MALINKNFSIRPGATRALRFKWYYVDDATKARTAFDLSDCTAIMQIREEENSTNVLMELSTANGRMSLTDEGDIVAIITSTMSSSYDTRKAVYDILITDTDTGIVTEFASGIVTLDRGVTR